MTIRTTSGAVESVLLNDYQTDADLNSYMETASVIVDRVSTCATAKGLALSSTELELIERWLSAHCYAMSDQPYSETETLTSRAKFQGETGMFLTATKYGQMATTLDYSGCLAEMGKSRVGGFWLGRRPSEQTPYYQRD